MSSSVCSSSNLPCLWSNSDVASGAKELTCDVPFVLEGERGWTTSSHHEELPLAYWLIGQWCITVPFEPKCHLAYWLIGQWCITVPFEPKCHLRLVAYWAPLTAMRKGSTAKSLHSGLSWPKGLGGASCKSRRTCTSTIWTSTIWIFLLWSRSSNQ